MLGDKVALLVKTILMIYAKTLESLAFQQKAIDPRPPAAKPLCPLLCDWTMA